MTLLEKAEILRNGAAKRGKIESAEYYEQLLIDYREVGRES